jgi:hypothetical protein
MKKRAPGLMKSPLAWHRAGSARCAACDSGLGGAGRHAMEDPMRDDLGPHLTGSGEFVATQGLAGPGEAKVVRGKKNGMPVTDGVLPESTEFLLGYWVVDVATPERAYVIAGRISAAPGPGGVPTNVPIEVRRFASFEQSKSK